MRKTLLTILGALLSLLVSAQEWEAVKADPAYIWGEGWGASIDEADQQALSALISRITIAVVSDFRQVEEQVLSSKGDEHYRMQSLRSSSYSNVTLSNTHRTILRSGRKSHVGRWIHRSELDLIFADRKFRILEYEKSARSAELAGRIDDALRYHYWAYVLLRSLQRPSELRSEDGRMLLNSIPESISAILEDVNVRMTSHVGDVVKLNFTFRGRPVGGLDFCYFDGARWSSMTFVRSGWASLDMAPGALAEYIQLKVEYAYYGDSLMDGELFDTMAVLNLKPIRKSYITFKAKTENVP